MIKMTKYCSNYFEEGKCKESYRVLFNYLKEKKERNLLKEGDKDYKLYNALEAYFNSEKNREELTEIGYNSVQTYVAAYIYYTLKKVTGKTESKNDDERMLDLLEALLIKDGKVRNYHDIGLAVVCVPTAIFTLNIYNTLTFSEEQLKNIDSMILTFIQNWYPNIIKTDNLDEVDSLLINYYKFLVNLGDNITDEGNKEKENLYRYFYPTDENKYKYFEKRLRRIYAYSHIKSALEANEVEEVEAINEEINSHIDSIVDYCKYMYECVPSSELMEFVKKTNKINIEIENSVKIGNLALWIQVREALERSNFNETSKESVEETKESSAKVVGHSFSFRDDSNLPSDILWCISTYSSRLYNGLKDNITKSSDLDEYLTDHPEKKEILLAARTELINILAESDSYSKAKEESKKENDSSNKEVVTLTLMDYINGSDSLKDLPARFTLYGNKDLFCEYNPKTTKLTDYCKDYFKHVLGLKIDVYKAHVLEETNSTVQDVVVILPEEPKYSTELTEEFIRLLGDYNLISISNDHNELYVKMNKFFNNPENKDNKENVNPKENKHKYKSMKMKFIDYINYCISHEVEFDAIIDDEEMPATFCFCDDYVITDYCKKKYGDLLNSMCEIRYDFPATSYGTPTDVVIVDYNNATKGKNFTLALAGYVDDNEWNKLFVNDKEDLYSNNKEQDSHNEQK